MSESLRVQRTVAPRTRPASEDWRSSPARWNRKQNAPETRPDTIDARRKTPRIWRDEGEGGQRRKSGPIENPISDAIAEPFACNVGDPEQKNRVTHD